MEIGNQIRKYRAEMGISQEELSEKIYVTRQTVSNWENAKSYPDIHSLLLMAALFGVSLDTLIKGDVEQMKTEINTEEIGKLQKLSRIYTFLFILLLLTPAPLAWFWGLYGFGVYLLQFAGSMMVAHRIEKLKKENDIHTYKEILAFMQGDKLDEISKHREEGKRPYQKILLCIGCAVLALLVFFIIIKILEAL